MCSINLQIKKNFDYRLNLFFKINELNEFYSHSNKSKH